MLLQKKTTGDIDNAVIFLKKAYEVIAKTDISYPVETFFEAPSLFYKPPIKTPGMDTFILTILQLYTLFNK